MHVYFSQGYYEDQSFPFSGDFQIFLSDWITKNVRASAKFVADYGEDWNLFFTISADSGIKTSEINGPGIEKKARDVEYSIVLPYDVILKSKSVNHSCLEHLMQAICSTLESQDIDTAKIKRAQSKVIDKICNDPSMFEEEDDF
jgi:hypothetical protein